MQEISSSNSPAFTGIWDPDKSWAQHHHNFKLGSKLKYLKMLDKFSIAYGVFQAVQFTNTKKKEILEGLCSVRKFL